MRKPRVSAVTAKEAAAILTTLRRREEQRAAKREGREPRAVTAANVRALLVLDTTGRVMQLDSGGALPNGQTRLYPAEDVALAWLGLKLRDAGVSSTVARVILNCWREQIVEVWHADDPLVLAVFGLRAMLLAEAAAKSPRAVAWVPLRPLWRAVVRKVQRTCAFDPMIPRWNASVPRAQSAEAQAS